jgi:hypothetical protein
MPRSELQARWRWFFVLAAVEAAASVAALAAVPGGSSGLSTARLALLLLLGALALASAVLAIRPRFIPEMFGRGWLLWVSGSISVVAGFGLFVLRYLRPDVLLPYFQRLGILLWCAQLLGLQALAWGLVVVRGPH